MTTLLEDEVKDVIKEHNARISNIETKLATFIAVQGKDYDNIIKAIERLDTHIKNLQIVRLTLLFGSVIGIFLTINKLLGIE